MGQHVSILITCRATGVLIGPDSEELDCGVEDSDDEHEPNCSQYSPVSPPRHLVALIFGQGLN